MDPETHVCPSCSSLPSATSNVANLIFLSSFQLPRSFRVSVHPRRTWRVPLIIRRRRGRLRARAKRNPARLNIVAPWKRAVKKKLLGGVTEWLNSCVLRNSHYHAWMHALTHFIPLLISGVSPGETDGAWPDAYLRTIRLQTVRPSYSSRGSRESLRNGPAETREYVAQRRRDGLPRPKRSVEQPGSRFPDLSLYNNPGRARKCREVIEHQVNHHSGDRDVEPDGEC